MNESEYHNLARMEPTHWWYTGMAGIAADWLRRLPAPAFGPVLDAGCGTGGGMGWLSQFGRPCGVDLHPLALRLAAAHGCQSLVQADVQALPFATERFAIVASFDVLYHLKVANDGAALHEFARILRPGGWLLLRLPAHNWLRGAHDNAVHTGHRYNRKEICAKLKAAGLHPVRVTYANALLFLPALLWRIISRGRTASDARLPWRPLNHLLTTLLHLEQLWLRNFNLPIGLSVLALAQKKETS